MLFTDSLSRQWGLEMGCWDAAFEEEADEFMYQMGQ